MTGATGASGNPAREPKTAAHAGCRAYSGARGVAGMAIDERVLDTIEAIYDAALDETLWPVALKQLADYTDSQAATFWVLDRSEQPRLPTFTYINLDPVFVAEYLDQVAPLDPTVQYLVAHPDQAVVHDGLFITEAEKDRHPYYDWHHRFSDTRFRLVNQIHPAPNVQAGIALHRTRAVGRYETPDIERFTVLHRHVQRALSLGFKLGSLGTLQQCTKEMLDRNPAAILLLNKQKRVVYANAGADRFRGGFDGIGVSEDGLTLARKQDHDRLEGLIAQALSIVASGGRASGGSMLALRPSGKRPFSILVTPVSARYPSLSTLRPAVCVAITDPSLQRPQASLRLRATFGLTEAETRLAMLLSEGEKLQSAAQKLRISYGTARARLAEIFHKTDTHRQSELIRLVLSTMSLD